MKRSKKRLIVLNLVECHLLHKKRILLTFKKLKALSSEHEIRLIDFDYFYNAELFLRAHGAYSIKIFDPLKFFAEAIPRNKNVVDIKDH